MATLLKDRPDGKFSSVIDAADHNVLSREPLLMLVIVSCVALPRPAATLQEKSRDNTMLERLSVTRKKPIRRMNHQALSFLD